MNNTLVLNRNNIWSRLGIVTLLLLLLVGPNFGPIPEMLHQRLSLETSVIGMLVSFWIGFCIIIAVILRLSGGVTLRELLQYTGLGVRSKLSANLTGLVVGILWGVLLLTSIFQFDPDANIAVINGYRILVAIIAATGALLEDVITRGYLMNEMQQLSVPNWAQALISAAIFALYHTVWAGFDIFAFIFSIVYGLILAGLFLWGNRSLTPVILGHSIAVLIGEPFASMLIFLSASL